MSPRSHESTISHRNIATLGSKRLPPLAKRLRGQRIAVLCSHYLFNSKTNIEQIQKLIDLVLYRKYFGNNLILVKKSRNACIACSRISFWINFV